MQIATEALVLRQVKVGEADRILTILTPEHGVISASAKNSLRLKSKLFSSCGLFCYSEFSITIGRTSNFIESGEIKKVFHGIAETVEGMALATYLAEIAMALSPAPPESKEHLRLLLNCFYMISEQKRPLRQIKAIYELRAMSMAGYMPDLIACAGCGRYDGGDFYIDPQEGQIWCAACAAKRNRTPNVDAGALYALRHICLADTDKLFNFTLSAGSLKHLNAVSEQYTLQHLEQNMKSLSFLKTVLD